MERENRKVLISVKVSTLLLILITVIGFIVLVNVIKNNLNKDVNVANIEYTEEKVEELNTHRVVNENLSSRDSSTEDKRTNEITENNEETKDEIIEIENEQQELINQTPSIIHGSVSGIKFDEVENSIAEDTVQEVQTTKIEDVVISKDMDLTVRTGLSREDFITLMAGVKEDKKGFFEENAGLIYDICEEYQINEIFFCGLIAGESGWHIADNHRRTYNYISLMSGGKLIKFSSVEDGLRKAAETLHNNYLTPGGKFYYGPTLAGVKTRFCPASSTWVNLIYGNMKKILY